MARTPTPGRPASVSRSSGDGRYEQQFAGELTVGVTGLRADPLGIGFREDDPNVDAFNAGLAAIRDDGTLDALIAKYWKN